MYKAQIVNHGIRIIKTGDTITECLDRLTRHLKTFHDEEHHLTYRPADGNIYTDRMHAAKSEFCIGKVEKELPTSCEG